MVIFYSYIIGYILAYVQGRGIGSFDFLTTSKYLFFGKKNPTKDKVHSLHLHLLN